MIFRRKPKVDHPKLLVVESRPGRRIFMIVSLGFLGVCCILLGFALGHNQVVVNRVSAALLSEDLAQTQDRMHQLEERLVDAELTAQVTSEAADDLREDLAQMQATNQKLQEEVTFYKSLMAPGSLKKGLDITELELARRQNPASFDFQLLLTQVAQRRSFIAGDVRLDIVGFLEGDPAEVVLSLTEVAPIEKYPLKFKFRYFQDLTGSLTLPEGFVPKRILITAQQQGKQALQETFPWPEWT
ncbi:MAG: DUF6776 family protein [Pseudomonadota bacterium]